MQSYTSAHVLLNLLNELRKRDKMQSYTSAHVLLNLLHELRKRDKMQSYTSAHVLLNLLNELRKRDKMRGLLSILSRFRNEFNKFNTTRARMLDSFYHMIYT